MDKFSIGKRMGWIVGFVTVAFFFSGSYAHAFLGGNITKYTADQVMIDAEGNVEQGGKIYVTPDKIRMSAISPGGQRNMVMIFRRDKNMSWTLNPDKKLYMERPLNEKEMEQATKKMIDSRNEKVLGTENVNGFKCTKKQVETTVEFMGLKKTVKNMVWASERLDIPLRTKSEDGSMTELRNIKEGTPANKYFEIPKEYKKVSNMMELMGMEMSGSGAKRSTPGNKSNGSGSQLPFKLPEGIKLPSGNN